ncbi:hypothetical protein PF010_g7573 [Phytophthora fragariae]|uniref:Uncharacterized protein n=2 Tax=Phytophthora fragariae TaxID=53985 RepID=A0A6A3LA56_9STRA|nr:hypothetical protein PF003_g40312 [Phytophthora fragariae]KAE9014747.1 hypothetical protein PF011_g7916 [Phytophthora fragariae]KAE9120219.1 hypothetical protein PF010_g7573 [Phytophthora fragariae]KAE9242781.1 hypothetical protein PF002_g8584 [Phytophthora fragariae]
MLKATPWTLEEDVRLRKAYTNLSEDGATSIDQNATAFCTGFTRRTPS